MAPLIRLFALFALATTVLASPHVSRNVYNHAHRAIARQDMHVDARSSLPRRQRSLNKRCIPRPTTNSTTSALPTSTAPINVAPLPSLPTSSPPPSSAAETTSSTSSYVPPSQAPPSPTTSASPSPTTQAPAPTTTTTTQAPAPAPTTSSTPPPAQTSSSSSNSGQPSYMTGPQTGAATWYEVGLGACGITNNDSQYIVAVAESLFDSYPGYDGVNPNTNPVCGKQITATYLGKSVTVTVADRCTGCQTTDLDMAPAAFDTLALSTVGRITINWSWS